MIRRLDPIADKSLLLTAFTWQQDTPRWYQDMDAVFGPEDVDDFLKMCAEPENILVGIFQKFGLRIITHELIGVVIAAAAGKDVFNSHLMAKRGASLETLIEGANQVTQDFVRLGMVEGFCWVAEKNAAVRKLCSTIGMAHEGITMYRGAYHGRVIKWLRYSIRAEAQAVEIAA